MTEYPMLLRAAAMMDTDSGLYRYLGRVGVSQEQFWQDMLICTAKFHSPLEMRLADEDLGKLSLSEFVQVVIGEQDVEGYPDILKITRDVLLTLFDCNPYEGC